MRDFIDLPGASGATYRFRLWPSGGSHLPMAGNYAFLRAEPPGFAVVSAAAVDDLSQVRFDLWPKAVEQGATHLFTRLNVSRAVRNAEADDIAAFYGLSAQAPARAARKA